MSEVRIRVRTPEDDERIVEIHRAIAHDRPPLTVEEMRHYMSVVPPDTPQERVVAERDGELVGHGGTGLRRYVKEPDTWWIDVAVDPRYWNQGMGKAIYDDVLERAVKGGARTVFAHLREDLPQARAFAERRGFRPTGHGDRISRLHVPSARLERSRDAARRLPEHSIRIATLTELGPDEAMLRAVCDLDNLTSQDIPGSSEWSPMPFEEWRKYVLAGPNYNPDSFWVALDGNRPVGLAALERRAGSFADNAYTGVHREYRGKGVARALKLHTVQWAAEHGIEYIYTGNDVENKPMLHINIDLGYQMLPASVEMVKDL